MAMTVKQSLYAVSMTALTWAPFSWADEPCPNERLLRENAVTCASIATQFKGNLDMDACIRNPQIAQQALYQQQQQLYQEQLAEYQRRVADAEAQKRKQQQ
jgi:hypothetical protein